MTEQILSLNNISPFGLAFDELAKRPIPPQLYEDVKNHASEISQNKIFKTDYEELITIIIRNEYQKRPDISLRQKVLIKEQIWKNAKKNLNTLILNAAVKHIKKQLGNVH